MTTEPNPAPVSQMAREAAAELIVSRSLAEIVRSGGDDGHCFVSAFARFEKAIRSTQVGESTRIAELEEALRPFKRAMEDWGDDKGQPDRWNIWEHPVAMNITLGDLRRASSVLSKGED